MDDALHLRLRNDHDTLTRVFASLVASLEGMAAGSGLDDDLLEEVREDLSFALEEMLEHFGVEEEVVFAQIREDLPEMDTRIDRLERDHETLCDDTARLRKMVAAARLSDRSLDIPEALEMMTRARALLEVHNEAEVKLFAEALDRLDEKGRIDLLKGLDAD
jgi:hypothetical protein